MSEFKRLTNKNLGEFNPEYDFCIGCKYFGEPNGCNRWNGTCTNYNDFNEIYNRLAELEDKIESGLLIEIPCKVGYTAYVIKKCCEKCPHFKDSDFEYTCWCDLLESKNMFEVDLDKDCVYEIKEEKFNYNYIPYLNKTVFKYKEEAEARLKELKEAQK